MKTFYTITSKNPLNTNIDCSLHTCGCRYSYFIWVSKKLELIYFEMPKAACTSILSALDISYSSPLLFSMPYIIHNQRYCTDNNNSQPLLTMSERYYGYHATVEEFRGACISAVSRFSDGVYWTDPLGEFEFSHFFGSAEEAIDLFPAYRKFIVLRDPIDRLLSSWNMFYNSDELRLQERVSQCKSAAEEKSSLRHFVKNMIDHPNHHFNSIGNYVPLKVILESDIEVVRFDKLNAYWELLQKDYPLPPLPKHNAAKSYLKPDIEKSELLMDDSLLDYYSADYKLFSEFSGDNEIVLA